MIRRKSKTLFYVMLLLFLQAGLLQGCDQPQIQSGAMPATTKQQSVQTEQKENAQYTGMPYEEVNGNQPDFGEDVHKKKAFERYSELDELGRCGQAYANIGKELMPTKERGAIGMVRPTGWHTVKYDTVDGKYLYNRCHLIAYQLAGENANEKNLITGTRYMNVQGMLPFEDTVAEYVKRTGHHVLYRVTPVYKGKNLVASGVQMEGYSVEDQGKGICFHVYVYNIQPGIQIDYATGDSVYTGKEGDTQKAQDAYKMAKKGKKEKQAEQKNCDYVINKNTKKFHKPDCASVKDTLSKNRKYYKGNREELLSDGYEPCGRCNP